MISSLRLAGPAMLVFASLAFGGTCSTIDVPVVWQLASPGDSTSVLQGDGQSYSNGVSGVEALLQECSGTHDATLNLSKSRKVTFDFSLATPLATNSGTPSWALGSIVTGTTFINLRNLEYVPAGATRAQVFSFTTRIAMSVPASGQWGLRMFNPGSEAITTVPDPAWNTPYTTSLVNVLHCPQSATGSGSCGPETKESWYVTPDNSPQGSDPNANSIATLLNTQKPTAVNAGQFRLPFHLKISLK